jgi:hypothetical protein
MQHW